MGPCGIHLLHLPDSAGGAGNDVDATHETEVGDWRFKCVREYGAVWYQTGCLGVSISSLISSRISEKKHRGIVW